MFDGTLSRDDWAPRMASSSKPSGWCWQLTALLLAMLILGILAAVLFPDVVATPADLF
jgi:hypothetical protein